MRVDKVMHLTYDGGNPWAGRRGTDVLSEEFSLLMGRGVALGAMHSVVLPPPYQAQGFTNLVATVTVLYPNILSLFSHPIPELVLGANPPVLTGYLWGDRWGREFTNGAVEAPLQNSEEGQGQFLPSLVYLGSAITGRYICNWVLAMDRAVVMLRSRHQASFQSMSLQLSGYLEAVAALPETVVTVHGIPRLGGDVTTEVVTDAKRIAEILGKTSPDVGGPGRRAILEN